MMFERFTTPAREVVLRAKNEARELQHPRIGTEHLLLGMLDETAGVAAAVLHAAGLDRPWVRSQVQRLHAPDALRDEDAEALKAIGIDLEAVRERVEEAFGPGALEMMDLESGRGLRRRKHRLGGNITPKAKKTLELALREALHLRHNYIGTEHILLGLIREGRGLGAQIVTERGVRLEDLRHETLKALGKAA